MLNLKSFHDALRHRLNLDQYYDIPGRRDFLSQVQLLSTLGMHDPPARNDIGGRGVITRELLGRLDRSELLRPGKAMLVARADGYMPARIRFDVDDVDVAGATVVRVLFDVAAAN